VSGPTPADKQFSKTGQWEMKNPGELVLTMAGELPQKLKVASVAPDKLVLKAITLGER